MKWWGKREVPEKTRQPAASPGTIPTYENPGAAPPGIEPGLPWWVETAVTTTPLRTPNTIRDCAAVSLKRAYPLTDWLPSAANGSHLARLSGDKGGVAKRPPRGHGQDLCKVFRQERPPRIRRRDCLDYSPSPVLPGFTPSEFATGFPHAGIVPGDAAGRRVFSGISRFPCHFIPVLLHTNLVSPLIGSQDLDVKSLPNLYHSLTDYRLSSVSCEIRYSGRQFSPTPKIAPVTMGLHPHLAMRGDILKACSCLI
ncbi:hypothetical protein PR048_007268, partial [Dryococelus australis]